VLGKRIVPDKVPQRLFLRRTERELLLDDRTALAVVRVDGAAVGGDAEKVVEPAVGEFRDEVGVSEIERPVVVQPIEPLHGVDDAQGAVAELRMELISRKTGDEGDAGLRRQVARLRRLGRRVDGTEEKKQCSEDKKAVHGT